MITLTDPVMIGIILACISIVGVLAVTTTVGVRFSLADAKLPAAVRWAELDEAVGAREERLRFIESEIAKREINLSERDRAEAEADHWRVTIEALKAEYANLGENRREIETVQEELRQAIEDLGAKETELRDLQSRAAAARSELEAVEARYEEASERASVLEREAETVSARRDALNEEVAEIERRRAVLESERSSVAGDVQGLRERLTGMRTEQEHLDRAIRRLQEERGAAEQALDSANKALAELAEDVAEASRVKDELNRLQQRREEAQERLAELDVEESRLQARVARLEGETSDFTGGVAKKEESALADLRTVPTCFATLRAKGGTADPVWQGQQPAEAEFDALIRVQRLLTDSGLKFSSRTLKAFHTSLKTAVVSPLTVLAGISGTGKSQLPRFYADAMGLHFLKIPVQPRWDSPQDLFGFYNYIEKRYKATELARALVHLDHHNWPGEAQPYQDRMLLVLLDEMNLARVEYYFSEFLSRLEGRPSEEQADIAHERRPAEIDVDIPRTGQPQRVYAGQNVLFVGTMNEDESTLALSDKVLDRANVLRFPKPAELHNTIPIPKDDIRAKGYLPKERWLKSWTRRADRLDEVARTSATGVIRELNEVMDSLGRPFGHRMSQAMLHYVANYPAKKLQSLDSEAVQNGLADQIEQRILPKLRGIDVSAHQQELEKLANIAGDRLKDAALAEAVNRAIRDSQSVGFFNWRGFTRSPD
jgi:predicted nuclease with TOPRIM domain